MGAGPVAGERGTGEPADDRGAGSRRDGPVRGRNRTMVLGPDTGVPGGAGAAGAAAGRGARRTRGGRPYDGVHGDEADPGAAPIVVRGHWQVLAGPVAVLYATAAACGFLLSSDPDPRGAATRVVALCVLVVLGRWTILPWLRWLTTSYEIADGRLATRTGILAVEERDVPLARIADVACVRDGLAGLAGWITGAGTLVIRTWDADGSGGGGGTGTGGGDVDEDVAEDDPGAADDEDGRGGGTPWDTTDSRYARGSWDVRGSWDAKDFWDARDSWGTGDEADDTDDTDDTDDAEDAAETSGAGDEDELVLPLLPRAERLRAMLLDLAREAGAPVAAPPVRPTRGTGEPV